MANTKRAKTVEWRPYFELDAAKAGLLPSGWDGSLRDAARLYGVDTVLTGDGSTSRESEPTVALPVRVVDGERIKAEVRWLWNLYRGSFREFCENCFHKALFPAVDTRSSVNINHLSGAGSRYEWHVDSNPVTGLLFITANEVESGGGLLFRKADGREARYYGRAGAFICFDARDISHCVEPINRGDRLTAPMNFYDHPSNQIRPEDLDRHIYGRADVVRA